MSHYTLSHLSDEVLIRNLAALVALDRATTATFLAHIAEVDARKLFVPAGYASMHAYCVRELRLSEDSAKKRIQAARAARQFPAIFQSLAEGRLHLAGICLLAPHLHDGNARVLLEAATDKRKAEIEELLARRFPLPDVRTRPITPIHSALQEDLEDAGGVAPDEGAPGHLPKLQSVLPPTAPERYRLELTIARSTRDKLRHAQNLLSHAVPNGDTAEVVDRALDALIERLERRRIGRGRRHVPARVWRAVLERDRGQCTFVSASGHRCEARRLLEFDHVEPVARGGKATVDNMRLRCRAHNQYEGERTFGAGFMRQKRREARVAAADARAREAAAQQTRDVLTGLRRLGCRASEARRAVEGSTPHPDATLEERIRAALEYLGNAAVSRTGARGR